MHWDVLYKAQRAQTLAVTGPYSWVRHPQYAGFIVIMLGFLLQWPTLITLAMLPILVVMYVRLAKREEREVQAELGAEYERYSAVTPGWFPRFGGSRFSGLEGQRPSHIPHPDLSTTDGAVSRNGAGK